MINFTSMATGFQNRGDENRIERRKVAEAFEQFKQNNPEATLAQFQQYIDSVSGGRNYLAGGAGSGETLRKLAADNQAKKARRLAAEAQAAKMARFKNERYIQEQLQDEIGNALISAKPTKPKEGPEGRLSGVQPKINYGRLAREFAENNPLVGEMGFDLSDLFTEQTRSQVMADYTEKNLPAVQTYITGLSAADLENVETDDIMRMYRLNPVIAEAVLKKAKGNLAEETELKVQELREQAGDHLRNLFSSGLLDETSNLEDAVRDRFKRHPNYTDAFLDPDGTMGVKMSNFTNSMQRSLTAIGAARDRDKELERGTRKSTVTANVMRLLQGESARAVSNLKRPAGFDLEKRRLLTLAQSAITDEFRDELTGNNIGSLDAATGGAVGELDQIIEVFLQGLAQEKVGNYQETTAVARIEAQTQAPLARQKAIDANIKVGTDAYGGDSKMMAGKVGGNVFAGDIVSILGKTFVMDPVTLGVIGKMLPTFMEGSGNNKTLKTGKDGAPLSALEMANEIADVLKTTNGVRGTDGLAARAEQLARAKVIGPDSLTFSQYEDRMTKSMGEAQDAVISEAELAYKDGLDGNLEAIDALKGLLREYTGETVPFYRSLTEAHRGTSKIWINNADERNSHWNQRRVDAMIGSLENGTVIKTINKMIEEISRNAAEQSRTMPSVPAPVVQPQLVSPLPAPAVSNIETISPELTAVIENNEVELRKSAEAFKKWATTPVATDADRLNLDKQLMEFLGLDEAGLQNWKDSQTTQPPAVVEPVVVEPVVVEPALDLTEQQERASKRVLEVYQSINMGLPTNLTGMSGVLLESIEEQYPDLLRTNGKRDPEKVQAFEAVLSSMAPSSSPIATDIAADILSKVESEGMMGAFEAASKKYPQLVTDVTSFFNLVRKIKGQSE